MVDLVFAKVELPQAGGHWRNEIARRCHSLREVFHQHPWSIGLLESRLNPGPATLRHLDAVVGTLRNGGFSIVMAAHAIAFIDAYVYGFAIQEATMPFEPSTVNDVAAGVLAVMPEGEYPYLVELATQHVMLPGYDFREEFDYGLTLVLDSIERAAGLHQSQR